MPKGDRTGPMGQGSATGRKLGFCSGYDSPGFFKGFGNAMGRGSGLRGGMGRGMGMERGFGRGRNAGWFTDQASWNQSISRKDEIRMLRSRAESLKSTQQEIESRIRELENEK